MKRLLICLLALPMLFSACNKPKEIPDDKLIAIVGDLFLANAYWSSTLMADSLRTDSVNIYAPIFERYGYRPKDFIHTIDRRDRESHRPAQTAKRRLFRPGSHDGHPGADRRRTL